MKVLKSKTLLLECLLLLSLSIIFLFIYGRYGYEGSDTSYMRGFSQSLINGKKLGETLNFPMTPVSLYITTIYYKIFGGFKYVVLGERFLHYVCISLITWFSFQIYVSKNTNLLQRTLLLSIAFMLNASNFPVSLSYTEISIAFACASLFFFKNNNLKVSGALLFLSIYSKQNFIIYSLLFFLSVFFVNKKKVLPLFVGFFSALLLAYIIRFSPIHGEMQDFGKVPLLNNINKIIKSGLIGYYTYLKLLISLPIITFMIKTDKERNTFFFSVIMIYLSYLLYLSFMASAYHPYTSNLGKLLLLFLLGHVLYKFIKQKIVSFDILCTLILAWTSGVANTSSGPWLLSGSLFTYLSLNLMNKSYLTYKLSLTLFIISMTFLNYSNFSYRTSEKKYLTRDFGEVDERYTGIRVSEKTLISFIELKEISRGLKKIHVLPSFSDANFLLNKPYCLPITWDLKGHLPKTEELRIMPILKKHLKKCDYVILQLMQPDKWTQYTAIIKKDWKIHKKYKDWVIYRR